MIVALLATLLRRLAASLSFVVGLGVAVTASLLAFGTGSFRDFSRYGPGSRPAGGYVDAANQSLLAALYRLSGHAPVSPDLIRTVLFPPFVAVAGALAVATTILCRVGRQSELATYLRAALLVSLALLVYPNTLYNTLVVIMSVSDP